MKKFLLSLACLATMSMASATTVTWTPSECGYANAEALTTVVLNSDITLTFGSGSNSNGPKYYNTGTAARLYGGNTMTVTGTNVSITEVEFNTPAGNKINAASTVTSGSLDCGDTVTTWTGEATEFTFTQGGTSGHARINSLTITYEAVSGETLVAPTFSLAQGEVAPGTEVIISTITEGGEIHYTLNGDEPTAESTLYTAPIVINATTTIKAITVKDGTASSVSTATYTVTPAYTLAEVNSLENGAAFKMGDNLVVTYAKGSYNYVADAAGTTFGLIYKANLNLNAGDVIKAGWLGTLSIYNNLVEMIPSEDLTTDGTAAVPAFAEVADATVLEDSPINSIVVLKEVTFDAATPSTATNFNGTFDGESLGFRNTFTVESTPAGSYDVTTVVSVYKDARQYIPISFTALSEVVYAPTFSIASGSHVDEGTTVSLSCETEGVTFYYTTDGNDPTIESTEYTAPIAITANMTIKAIAVKDGVVSDIAEASYTVTKENEAYFTGWTTLFGVDQDGSKNVAADEIDWTATVKNVTMNVKNGSSTNSYLKAEDFRVYKDYTITFTVPETCNITNIQSVKGGISFGDDAVSANTGTVTQDSGAITWTGYTNSVVLSFTGKGAFKSITVTIAMDTAVDGISDDSNAPEVYYNLQGIPVENPTNGIFIKKQGNRTVKVLK